MDELRQRTVGSNIVGITESWATSDISSGGFRGYAAAYPIEFIVSACVLNNVLRVTHTQLVPTIAECPD